MKFEACLNCPQTNIHYAKARAVCDSPQFWRPRGLRRVRNASMCVPVYGLRLRLAIFILFIDYFGVLTNQLGFIELSE